MPKFLLWIPGAAEPSHWRKGRDSHTSHRLTCFHAMARLLQAMGRGILVLTDATVTLPIGSLTMGPMRKSEASRENYQIHRLGGAAITFHGGMPGVTFQEIP